MLSFLKNLVIPSNIRKIITYVIICIIAFFLLKFAYQKFMGLTKEIDRLQRNMENVNFNYETTQTKTGELMYSVNSLTVKANELALLNTDLNDAIKNLNLKTKNLQSVTNITYKHETVYDTIYPTLKISDFKYLYSFDDDYTYFSSDINLPKEMFKLDTLNNSLTLDIESTQYPYLSNFNYLIKDTLLIATEFQYKRRWLFWKKVVGAKVHVKSENPNFNLDKIETFQIKK